MLFLLFNFTATNSKKLADILATALDFKIIRQELDQPNLILYNPDLSKDLLIWLQESHMPIKPLTKEHLLIFYLKEKQQFEEYSSRLIKQGAEQVTAFNPYWDQYGATFLLPDQLRVVLCQRKYSGYRARIAMPAPDLAAIENYFEKQFGFKKIDEFHGHVGFDGVMLAIDDMDCHLEFTHYHATKTDATSVITNRFSVALVEHEKK